MPSNRLFPLFLSSVRYGIPRWFNGTGDLHLNLSQEGEGSGAESLDGLDGNLNVVRMG